MGSKVTASIPLSAAQMRNVIDSTYLQHATRAMVSPMSWPGISNMRKGRLEMLQVFATHGGSIAGHELADYVTTHGVHTGQYFAVSIAELRDISNHIADTAVKEGHVEGAFVILTEQTLENIERGEI